MSTLEQATFIGVDRAWYISVTKILSGEMVKVKVKFKIRVFWYVTTSRLANSYLRLDVFGGLVVSMLASGTQVCGFKPGRSRWIFTGVKILRMPSSGGEVKESVPCLSFAACKRT